MSYNVDIIIFGKLSDLEAATRLADAAKAEADIEDFADLVAQAAGGRGAIELNAEGYAEAFEDVVQACHEAGLSYVWTIGELRGDGPTNGVVWKPGLPEAIPFLVQDRTFGLSLGHIRKAASLGIEAVNELVATVGGILKGGRIEVEPGFTDALDQFLVARDEAASDVAP